MTQDAVAEEEMDHFEESDASIGSNSMSSSGGCSSLL